MQKESLHKGLLIVFWCRENTALQNIKFFKKINEYPLYSVDGSTVVKTMIM